MMSVVQRSLRLVGLLVLVTVWLGLALPVAQPYTVCPSGCPFSKIQAALDAAKDGETITVGPGVYRENLKITKSVSLVGADPAQVRLMPGGPAFALIQVGDESTLGTVRIEGFTLQQAASLVESSVYTDVLTGVQTLIFRNNRVLNREELMWPAWFEASEVIMEGNFLSNNSSVEIDGQHIRVINNDLSFIKVNTSFGDPRDALVEGNTFREWGLMVSGNAVVRKNQFRSAGIGIDVGGQPFDVDFVQVLENEFIGPGVASFIKAEPDTAIRVGDSGDRVLIEGNKIANYEVGIKVDSSYNPAPEIIIRKNTISQGWIGIQLDKQWRESTKIQILENTIDRQRRPSEQDLAGAGILIYRFVEQVEVLLQGNTLRLGDFGVLLMPGSGKFEFQGNTITDNDLFGVFLAVPPCGEVVDPTKVQVTGSGNEIANNGKRLPPEAKQVGDGEGNVCPKELISLKK